MSSFTSKKAIFKKLQEEILQAEGYVAPAGQDVEQIGLGPAEAAFPNGVFPQAAIHEFIAPAAEGLAASMGFISGIIGRLMQHRPACLWITSGRSVFPPALQFFGIPPHKVIFLDIRHDKDVLWAMEEGLKCTGLTAVVGEIGALSFSEARRLQLAVEASRVTGFLLRTREQALKTTASAARWQIEHLPSRIQDGLPGIGHPRWRVSLMKVRSGNPGSWDMEWSGKGFEQVAFPPQSLETISERRTG